MRKERARRCASIASLGGIVYSSVGTGRLIGSGPQGDFGVDRWGMGVRPNSSKRSMGWVKGCATLPPIDNGLEGESVGTLHPPAIALKLMKGNIETAVTRMTDGFRMGKAIEEKR